ncbi:unnamed protein product, partial [Owenia fusiformis]
METSDSCQPIKFSDTPLPLTALYSWPGSGNTWVRHLLQQLTGIYTGSMYHDLKLRTTSFPGESYRNGSVIAIKTHHKYSTFSDKVNLTRAIVIIRHPLDAHLANEKRMLMKSHTGEVNATMLNKLKTIIHNDKRNVLKLEDWSLKTLRWVTVQNIPILILSYESLVLDLKPELLRISHFLNTDITERLLQCVLRNSDGLHLRRKHTQKVHFSRDIKATADDIYTKTLWEIEQLCSERT